ncbi:MAG: AraC family transcriptional regulator [Clostridia bacterium]|nr:AraC family transcriptional regulator [Clostridia bacterium]
MKINEAGVLPESNVYFHTASLTAQNLYFTLNCTGRYICSGNYAVSRPSYDSFLLLYVVRGRGYCYINGQREELSVGSMIILDCYQPHRYGTDTSWEILWVHFNGRMARDYYESIVQSGRQIIMPRNGYHAARGLEKIYAMFHVSKRVNEAVISKNIVAVLTEFLVFETPKEPNPEHSLRIEEILSYINENLDQPITLETLAQRASLSTFYFSRVFKKETGYAPREYLIHTRMNAARFYLRTTDLTLKEITYRCGYGSESTFCTMFKRVTGTTPLEYRNQQ